MHPNSANIIATTSPTRLSLHAGIRKSLRGNLAKSEHQRRIIFQDIVDKPQTTNIDWNGWKVTENIFRLCATKEQALSVSFT